MSSIPSSGGSGGGGERKGERVDTPFPLSAFLTGNSSSPTIALPTETPVESGGRTVERDIELNNGTITLRPYRTEDIDILYNAVRESLNELLPWMPWCHPDYSRNESETWVQERPEQWENGLAYDFTIRDTADDSFLGACGIDKINSSIGMANLGYWMRTGRTKQGTATAATLLLAEFGFEKLSLNRIEIIVAVDNLASRRVAEKSGATREGVLRNRLMIKGAPHDAVMFSLVPEDLLRIEGTA